MAFLKIQKLVKDADGHILSGSAAIVESVYHADRKYHSKQVVKEKLGKVISLADDKKSGVFLSPTRGLVHYNVRTDSFRSVSKDEPAAVESHLFPEAQVHTVFGDAYLLLVFLKNTLLTPVLSQVFEKEEDYHRLLCHILHGILKDGSKISCDSFIEKSFASYLLSDVSPYTLRSDTYFYTLMGEDSTRLKFFKTYVDLMKNLIPEFGKGCYVDSTPLPNDIEDNPFNALCSHGLRGCDVQMRLVLVLDEATGLPVWYDIIPGNLLDLSTIMNVLNDVSNSLGIEIEQLVLDAGYVSKELLQTFHIGTEKTIIARMPAKRGYPFKELYHRFKNEFPHGKYSFIRNRHTYFGQKCQKEIQGVEEYVYVYVDKDNALLRFKEYLLDNEDEFEGLKDKDKDWMTVKYGYFVLVSNIDTTPQDMLDQYFERTRIESVFKTAKEYLDLLPLSKWSDQTVRGKILSDIINTIVFLELRKRIDKSGNSTSWLFGKTQSLMGAIDGNGLVMVETPNKQAKKAYGMLEIDIPSRVDINEFKRLYL